MTPAERLAGSLVVAIDKSSNNSQRVGELPRLAVAMKNLFELLRAGIPDQHLVLDPAQKGFVTKSIRFQIGREDEERLERDGDFSTGAQGEIVDPPLHRNNPPVQHLRRRRLLTAEIVDQIDAVVRG